MQKGYGDFTIIPEFKTYAGVFLPERDLGEGQKQISVLYSNEEEYKAYKDQLEKEGFLKISENDIPLFYAYKKGDISVFVNFFPKLTKTHIYYGKNLPAFKGEYDGNKKAQPSITQCTVGGMSYAIKLADGSFIVIDGGFNEKGGKEELYSVLKKDLPESEKPCISMWFFTHPDIDHIELATAFIREYREKVNIRGIAYGFSDSVEFTSVDTEKIRKNIRNLEDSIKALPDTPVYYLYTGDVFDFCGVRVTVLWTGDSMYPCVYTTPNDLSAAFRFEFEKGKRAVFFGDCMNSACRQMGLVYGEYLKCEIFQVTHHGLIGGNTETYKLVNPDICFWPVPEDVFWGKNDAKYKWCLGEGGCDYNRWIRDDSVRRRTHYHKGSLATVFV